MKILLILSEPRTIFLNFPRCRRSAELMDGGSGSSGTGEECSVGLFRSGRAEREFRCQETERWVPLVHMTRRGTAPIFGESRSRMASAPDQALYEHD